MRILLLGKDGMLGHDLVKTFQKEELMMLGQKDLDITDQENLFDKLLTLQPEVIVNATGYTDVSRSEKEPDKANEVNGYAVGFLAKAARDIRATLVHFSTDYVFDGNRPQGYIEDYVPNPINAYGRSKELGEKLLIEEMELQHSPQQKEGSYFLLRTSWLFGSNGKNFVNTMLQKGQEFLYAGKKAKPLKVVNDQHGKPTYTLDLAQQVYWLLKTREYPAGIYHVTNEEETSWYDFAKTIFEKANMEVEVIPCSSTDYPSPAKRPHFSGLINTKLPPLRPWKEALAAYLREL